ncbi:hypothetical protein [Pseudomonas sp.]|uniref:hypothetical protein n=1 Tax=Pseudomonas sp. TaxID=306 RepID=UPI00257FB976|nr:hypothetical protein [Pseudomonas sp.]
MKHKPQNRNLLIHPKDIEASKIGSLISKTNLSLRKILEDNWPKELNGRIDKNISQFLETPKISWKDISNCWENTYKEEKRSSQKLHFFYAKIFYLSAKIQNEDGNTEKAFLYISHAAYLTGFIHGYQHYINEKTLRTKRSSGGGNGKISKISKIRTQFSLLLKNPPPDGWGTETETIEAIYTSKDFTSFISEIEAEKTVKNLKEFITEELIHDKTNQAVYKSLRKK